MEFPNSIWPDPSDRDIVRAALDLFSETPLIVTDELANAVYFNPRAESLFGHRGESLVNRATFSLLSLGDDCHPVPAGLSKALLGQTGPWKAIVQLEGAASGSFVCRASAIQRGGRHLAGLIRLASIDEGARPEGLEDPTRS